MHERIKQLRSALNLTQQQFADAVNLSRNYIAMVETGQREPGARTISDICRVYGVNEVWLRTGAGEMLRQVPEGEALAAQLGELLRDVDADFKRRLISELLRLPPEAWAQIEAFARRITSAGEEKEEAGQ